MKEALKPSRWSQDVLRSAAPPRQGEPLLPLKFVWPTKVRLLPGHYRGARYVAEHVKYVLTRSPEQGEQHIQANLGCIRENLEAMGVAETEIQSELRQIESAVRREMWRQVLGGDQ